MTMISAIVLSFIVNGVTSANDYSICDAYSKLDVSSPCGSKGYALQFGLPICKKFIDNELTFTAKGQKFLRCVRPCLADFISANITGKVTDCCAIRTAAFRSHVPCYDKCNFCDVVLSNFGQFAKTFEVSDFFSGAAIKQVLQVAGHCIIRPFKW